MCVSITCCFLFFSASRAACELVTITAARRPNAGASFPAGPCLEALAHVRPICPRGGDEPRNRTDPQRSQRGGSTPKILLRENYHHTRRTRSIARHERVRSLRSLSVRSAVFYARSRTRSRWPAGGRVSPDVGTPRTLQSSSLRRARTDRTTARADNGRERDRRELFKTFRKFFL